jgi:hypothetical protein
VRDRLAQLPWISTGLGLQAHRFDVGKPQTYILDRQIILEPIATAVAAKRTEDREAAHVEIV